MTLNRNQPYLPRQLRLRRLPSSAMEQHQPRVWAKVLEEASKNSHIVAVNRTNYQQKNKTEE